MDNFRESCQLINYLFMAEDIDCKKHALEIVEDMFPFYHENKLHNLDHLYKKYFPKLYKKLEIVKTYKNTILLVGEIIDTDTGEILDVQCMDSFRREKPHVKTKYNKVDYVIKLLKKYKAHNTSKDYAQMLLEEHPNDISNFLKKEYCGDADTIFQTCQFEGCKRNPTHNYKNENRRKFCKDHKLDGMHDKKQKLCGFEDCLKQSSFGYEKIEFCKTHKKDSMVNLKRKK